MRIKVIKNSPVGDVASIEDLIGKEFDVIAFDEEYGEVSVNSEYFGGQIVLYKEEYEIIT